MWINSLGTERYVHNLFEDVRDGMVILQEMDQATGRGGVAYPDPNPDPNPNPNPSP